MKKTILITGGAGFIGSHVVRRFVKRYHNYKIVVVDKLTYAGNLENLKDLNIYQNYSFIHGDICNSFFLDVLFKTHEIDGIIHLAAESHVDRSLTNPMIFVDTNVNGTMNLLISAMKHWRNYESKRFYHISTDEVYGSADNGEKFTEKTPINPNSPYSASKASADHFIQAYHNSFGLPTIISRCSNNYGPNHFPEKLIPLMINNIINRKPLPVYGNGENVRDWLYVIDHAEAIDTIYHNGKVGEVYNIGGNNEWRNIDLVYYLCKILNVKLNRPEGDSEKLITFVTDRKGHDLRYTIDSSKLQRELGWKPSVTFEEGLNNTVEWYLDNQEWLDNVTSGSYRTYYDEMYEHR